MPRIATSLAAPAPARDKENVKPAVSRQQHAASKVATGSSFVLPPSRDDKAARTRKRRSDDSDDEGGDGGAVSGHVHMGRATQKVQADDVLPGTTAKDRNHSSSTTTTTTTTTSGRSAKTSRADTGLGGAAARQKLARSPRYKDDVGVARQGDGHITTQGLSALERERDEVQMQFDELRELRATEPERVLAEWKKTAEQHSRHSDEYIATLRQQLDALQRQVRQSRPGDGKIDETESLRHRLEESKRREHKLEEDVARLRRDLQSASVRCADRAGENDATSRLAARARIGSGALGASDERAVRRLYEDLTGLVVNKVESVDATEKASFRRFHAIFACAGYHDLEIKLEESTSSLPSSDSGPGSSASASARREDLIYTPIFDTDRDADLLQSGRLPEYLREAIRFERTTAVKFLNALHKRLDRHAKR